VNHRFSRPSIFLFILTVTFTASLRLASACGPFSRYAIFSYTKHPDLPFNSFASGELGVLRPTYARSYLFAAYRLMSGGTFNQAERDALSGLWNERLGMDQENRKTEDSMAGWLSTRKKVSGFATDPKIEVYRSKAQSEFDSFLNCPDDAFRNAAKTLEERITKFGADSAEVKQWVFAQDQVFSNCGGGQNIPEKAAPSSAGPIQADREYQIAAAHFYAMNFDEARSRFEKIASDSSSGWREQAPYLVARSLIRKASLGPDSDRKASLLEAERQLSKVLLEVRQSGFRKSAQKLLDLVRLRLDPAKRLRELSQALLKEDANLKQDLWDYSTLLDRYLGDSDQPLDENLKKALDASGKDDLSDWLITFQATDADSLEHSLNQWGKTNSLPWLIASLSKINAGQHAAASLTSAAERIESSSTAFATAQFHLIRLLTERGDRAGAARNLESVLQRQNTLPASAVNQFLHQRMSVASNVSEFLRYAQRRPAAFSWDDDGREIPTDAKADDELRIWAGRVLLDVDSTRILNEQFPLALLREAAADKSLPDHIRRGIALSAWTRAALLDDVETGRSLALIAAALAPELKVHLDRYRTATTKAQRSAAALYTILKFPGLRPLVDPSFARLTPLGERDSYRDNWWCEISTRAAGSSDEKERSAAAELIFLTDTQKASAVRELTQLSGVGNAPNYLARETIEWARRTPNDPRVPEALHIVVTATRYGCTDKETGKWSKAAWQLLHSRYPKNPWTRKTPYWFNLG